MAVGSDRGSSRLSIRGAGQKHRGSGNEIDSHFALEYPSAFSYSSVEVAISTEEPTCRGLQATSEKEQNQELGQFYAKSRCSWICHNASCLRPECISPWRSLALKRNHKHGDEQNRSRS